MELNWLKYFFEVAKSESVTIASQRMRVSQPAVTKMIKQLEESLQLSLFQKAGRKIALTEEGKSLLKLCLPIFNKIEEIKTLPQTLSGNWGGPLKLGASDNICNYILPEAMTSFTKEFPSVEWLVYSGSSTEIKQKLTQGEIDYGIFYTRLSLKEQQMFQEEFLVDVDFSVVHKPHTLRKYSVKDLNKTGMSYIGAVTADYTSTVAEQWIYNKVGLKPKNLIQSNSKEMQKQLVLNGLGYGIFPSFMVEKEVRAKKLSKVKVGACSAGLYLISRKNENKSQLMEMFIQDFTRKNHLKA